MAATLAVSGHRLDEEDRAYLRAVINSRTREQAGDRSGAGDVLQAAECTRENLAAMLATRDRHTLAGLRDCLGLSLAWYMAGRTTEPTSLHVTDVREVAAGAPRRGERRGVCLARPGDHAPAVQDQSPRPHP
ncbi:hypothetical protein ACFT38_30940 [Streptomyces sp. NPDC056975]|uniref:hypothetical protein n=1 Tax=Streptomyces sp. NPDC056975 TaxID=3345985 RepID=UPI0036322928